MSICSDGDEYRHLHCKNSSWGHVECTCQHRYIFIRAAIAVTFNLEVLARSCNLFSGEYMNVCSMCVPSYLLVGGCTVECVSEH